MYIYKVVEPSTRENIFMNCATSERKFLDFDEARKYALKVIKAISSEVFGTRHAINFTDSKLLKYYSEYVQLYRTEVEFSGMQNDELCLREIGKDELLYSHNNL